MIEFARIEAVLERDDGQAALLRDGIDDLEERRGMDPERPARYLDEAGFLSAEAFARMLESEMLRCAKTQDTLGVLYLEYDQTLDRNAEMRLARELAELASHAGEFYGRVDDGYAIALPWADVEEAKGLQRVLVAVARNVAPGALFRTGTRCEIPQPGLSMLPAQLERHAATRSRGHTR